MSDDVASHMTVDFGAMEMMSSRDLLHPENFDVQRKLSCNFNVDSLIMANKFQPTSNPLLLAL